MLEDLTKLARDAVVAAGYAGIVAAMVAENLFPPIPSELVLPLAGYEASRGELVLLWVVVAATLGSLIGALVLYALGRYGGRPAIERWGGMLRVTPRDLDRADRWFERWGDWVVLGARVVPVARSVVSIPAGAMQMPLPRFCVLTVVGSLLWNTLLVGAGHQLGQNWDEASHLVSRFSDVAVVVALAAIAAVFVLWRRRAARNA